MQIAVWTCFVLLLFGMLLILGHLTWWLRQRTADLDARSLLLKRLNVELKDRKHDETIRLMTHAGASIDDIHAELLRRVEAS